MKLLHEALCMVSKKKTDFMVPHIEFHEIHIRFKSNLNDIINKRRSSIRTFFVYCYNRKFPEGDLSAKNCFSLKKSQRHNISFFFEKKLWFDKKSHIAKVTLRCELSSSKNAFHKLKASKQLKQRASMMKQIYRKKSQKRKRSFSQLLTSPTKVTFKQIG